MTFKDSHGNSIPLPKQQTIHWRISGYAIIKNVDNHFLMVQSGGGLWHFPGGGVELTENISEAVRRECLEETGYEVRVEPQVYHLNEQPFYHTREQAFYHSLQLFFIASLTDPRRDTQHITGHDTERAISWVDLNTVQESRTHDTILELVKELRQTE